MNIVDFNRPNISGMLDNFIEFCPKLSKSNPSFFMKSRFAIAV